MALREPTGEHKRRTTLVFNPEEKKDKDLSYGAVRKKKVAAYARVSTEQDAQQNSYEAQIEYYKGYIQGKPEWEYVDVYADEGISGTSFKNRDGFNQMVADAKAGKIDLILTKSISRFARNTVDALSITRELKSYNVEVYFEKENISSMDAQAELIFTIMSSIAQEESRSISENVRWGKQRAMEAGKVYLPYSSFLGYERGEDGLPKIVEEEAVIVRGIYEQFLCGDSLNKIAEDLNQRGIPTPSKRSGTVWKAEGVRRILTNEKYKGDARLQKTYVEDFLTKKVKKNTGERRQWYIEDSHDAIVSSESFALVQQELARRTGRHGRFYDSPFTSKLICGDCGGLYGHRIWHSSRPCRKEVWYCNERYDRAKICNTPVIDEEEIKQAFLEAVNRITDRKEYCDAYEREILPLIGDVTILENQVKVLNQEHNDAIDDIEGLVLENARRAQDQSVYESRFNELSRKIKDKEAKIEEIRQQISDILCRKQNAQIFLKGLREAPRKGILTEFDIRTWHAIVESATVMPNNTIIFHFRNKQEETVKLKKRRKAK